MLYGSKFYLYIIFFQLSSTQRVPSLWQRSTQAVSNPNAGLECDLPSGDRMKGWIEQSNYRGTIDILWTCFVTIFICTYTTICLNVPSPQDTLLTIVRRRTYWMVLAIIGPEFPLTYAAGQWSRARHSVEAFRQSGYKGWTMRHAFFADMGGFTFCPERSPEFPLNAKQLHWLVVHGYIEFPSITVREIWDKSKQDRTARLISAFQVGYIIVQCIGRAVQHLAITTLELNTIGIVVCSLMTSFAWLHKPCDVQIPVRITSKFKIEEIVGHQSWDLTPLDFVDENGPGWAVNVQPFMRMPTIPSERPIQRIPNDRFPTDAYGWQEYLLCLATTIFTAIHVAGWNFSFPSQVEKIMWRSCSLILFGSTVLFWIFETIASWFRLGRWKQILDFVRRKPTRNLKVEHGLPRARPLQQQRTQLPVAWEFWTIMPLAILYGLARIYLIVEAFLELRDMDKSAYVNVQWSTFIPHV